MNRALKKTVVQGCLFIGLLAIVYFMTKKQETPPNASGNPSTARIAANSDVPEEAREVLSQIFKDMPDSATASTPKIEYKESDPLQRKIGWRPEDYFEDKNAVALCHAIEQNDIARMEFLIKTEKVDPNLPGKDNMTFLLWAYITGEEALECLLKHGADPNVFFQSGFNTYGTVTKGQSIMHVASMAPPLEKNAKFKNYLKLFMNYGGNPDLIEDNPLVCTPLEYAIKSGRIADVGYMIQAGADVNRLHERSDWYPLKYADAWGHMDCVLMLIKAGADIEIQTSGDSSFLERISKTVETHEDRNDELGKQVREIKSILKERGYDTEQIHSLELKWKEKMRLLDGPNDAYRHRERYGVFNPGVNKPRKYSPPNLEKAVPLER